MKLKQFDENNKLDIRIITMIMICMIVFFFANYNGEIDNYNTTLLALNYTYGFRSRGLLGTVFLALDKVVPFSLLNAWGARRFYQASLLVFFGVILVFSYYVVRHAHKKKVIGMLCVYMTIILTTTFSGEFNFGRVDMYMIAISLLGALALLRQKGEWLVIPLSICGVMLHQGYVMMYFNILLVLLVYRFFSTTNKNEKKKYAIIFGLSFIIASALFLYFELFSHPSNGEAIFDEVRQLAVNLADDGTYHKTLLQHEILGVDLSEVEHSMHMKNLVEIVLFAGLTSPYLFWGIGLFRRIYKQTQNLPEKLKYLCVFLGSLTMLPDFLIKVDYGRWVLSVIVYYLVMMLSMFILDDKFELEICKMVQKIKGKPLIYMFALIYPILMVPFFDVNINQITAMIGHVMNREWLHWW